MEPEENRNDINCLRPLFCQVGALSRCDGSAQLNQGGTTIICGVYGPAEVRPHKEMLESIVNHAKQMVIWFLLPRMGLSVLLFDYSTIIIY